MGVTDLLQTPARRHRWRRQVRTMIADLEYPEHGERFLLSGRDPIRIVLLGSGAAVGYGVSSRAQALDGQLGALLGPALNRGIVVDNVALHSSRLADQVMAAVMGIGLWRSNLLVWCPSFLEMTDGRLLAAWERQLSRLLTLCSSAPVVVLELPRPVGDGADAVQARREVSRINARLRQAVLPHRRVAVVRPPDLPAVSLEVPFDGARYYAELAPSVATAAVGLLRNRVLSDEYALA